MRFNVIYNRSRSNYFLKHVHIYIPAMIWCAMQHHQIHWCVTYIRNDTDHLFLACLLSLLVWWWSRYLQLCHKVVGHSWYTRWERAPEFFSIEMKSTNSTCHLFKISLFWSLDHYRYSVKNRSVAIYHEWEYRIHVAIENWIVRWKCVCFCPLFYTLGTMKWYTLE